MLQITTYQNPINNYVTKIAKKKKKKKLCTLIPAQIYPINSRESQFNHVE
jgi:hypothetical protein